MKRVCGVSCWRGQWITKNGRHIYIGGSCEKALVAVIAVLVLSAAAGVSAGTVVATGVATETIAAQSVQTRVTNSRSSARRGQSTEAWRRMGLRAVTRAAGREIRREIRQELNCAATSSGQVREFFGRTPCRSMQQTQSQLCDEHGNTITVSVTWVRMPTAVSAQRFKLLIDRDGTGSVSAGVRFSGKHYSSRRTGSLVVVAEAAAAGGRAGAAMLDGVAEVAAEFPDPQ